MNIRSVIGSGLVLALMMPSLTSAQPRITGPFTDIDLDSPLLDAASFLRNRGIVQGYEDGALRPDRFINRAEFTTIVLRAFQDLSKPECAYPEQLYSDVPANAWYAAVVCSATSQKVIEGYADGTFRPEQPITFAEASKIIAATANVYLLHEEAPAESKPWYRSSVQAMEGWRAIPESIRSFDQRITRGQMVDILYRVLSGNLALPSGTYEEIARNHQRASGNVIIDPTVLRPGDEVGGMVVESASRGRIVFTGDITLTSVYMDYRGSIGLHPDGICMETSHPHIPVLEQGTLNFCFIPSEEVDAAFGPWLGKAHETSGIATVVIDSLALSLEHGAFFHEVTLKRALYVSTPADL